MPGISKLNARRDFFLVCKVKKTALDVKYCTGIYYEVILGDIVTAPTVYKFFPLCSQKFCKYF